MFVVFKKLQIISSNKQRGETVRWSGGEHKTQHQPPPVSPVEKYFNQIICVISGSTCDVGSPLQRCECSHARGALSEWGV